MSAALVVCADTAERRRYAAALRSRDMEVVPARSRAQATSLLRKRTVDVVLFAASQPDAIASVRDLRSRTDRPLIAVSAPVGELTTVALLDAGADDVVCEPVGVEELLARLRARLRRCARVEDREPVVTDDFTIYLADRRFIRADGSEMTLSPTEWRLIEVLVHHAGHLVSREDVLTAVWGPSRAHKTQYLRVYMTGIRRKVEPEPAHPRYFVTVPGLGLRFVSDPITVRQPAS
jgi:two-component system KDP operon response regulator KdpE